jgi:hypothetical protein
LALVAVSTTRAIITPIPITSGSYNADVVVEKTATPVLKVVTTASVDQGTNNGANTWMEAGYDLANPGSGLPAPGTVIVASSNPNYSFQMPPDYTQPNGILINATQVTNGHLKVTTPATYTLLSFLSSGGNGGDVIGVKIYHQDGTIQTGPSFPSPDWFNGTSNVAFVAEGRLGSTVNFTSANINSGNPRLYFRDVPVNNTASVITNIELYYVSGPASSHNDILAVSGATTVGGAVIPVAVTGWTYDFIAEKEAAKRGRVITDVIVDGTNVWATTHSLDGIANTGNSWYEVGYNVNNPDGGGVPIPDVRVATNSGLPVAGSLVTNAIGDRYYQMPADYTVNNAIWIADPTSLTTNAVITLQNPTAASVLSFLASSGGGAVRVDVIITHADASTETNSVVIPDWFNGANPVINANGRVAVDTAQFNNVRGNPQNPRLYGVDFILNNTASPVTTIEVVNTNSGGGRFAILALSGTLDPVLPSFVSNPQSVTVNVGANVQFTASAVANVPITYRWQKGTNGVFVDLTDGGNISGATTTTLSVNNVGDADDAEYRLVATDSAGSANSGVAVLTVLSALTDVTVPTDAVVVYQPNGGSFPGGEAPPNAINDNTTKYLNRGNGANPLNVPVGFTVTPSAGRTIVSALRFYTANDADVRDPANSILEGSKDGGATWTLISSNALTLPAGRNAANLGLDPLTQNIRQLRFNNTNNYSSYRWYTTRVKGATDLMQIGEIEFLGVVDTADPSPFFVTQPTSVVAFNGSSASFNAFASGTPAPSVRWLKGTNGVYVALSDGGSISGSQSGNLSINPVSFGDASDFVCVATNASGSVTSSVVKLTVISTLTDITTPGDPITDFGDQSLGLYAGNPAANAIDNLNSTSHRNGGSGPNTSAGFPPFGGPVGFVVTPSVGSTLVTGLRFYTAADQPELDPANYVLEGSNNGGTSYSPIATGSLTLPLARADNAQIFDPTVQPVQEVLFANNGVYSSYRLTINNVRGPVNDADSMQIGEVELLGVTAVAQPVLSVSISGGQLTISSSINGTLQSATNLTGTIIWVNEGPINGSVNITPAPGTPQKYYRAFYQTP